MLGHAITIVNLLTRAAVVPEGYLNPTALDMLSTAGSERSVHAHIYFVTCIPLIVFLLHSAEDGWNRQHPPRSTNSPFSVLRFQWCYWQANFPSLKVVDGILWDGFGPVRRSRMSSVVMRQSLTRYCADLEGVVPPETLRLSPILWTKGVETWRHYLSVVCFRETLEEWGKYLSNHIDFVDRSY